MSDPEPTPGPWHANGGAVYATAECRANDALPHGKRGAVEPLAVTRRGPADAVLMAAGPELLMACEMALAFGRDRLAYTGPDADRGAGHVLRTLARAVETARPSH